jgi:hypothetical protein
MSRSDIEALDACPGLFPSLSRAEDSAAQAKGFSHPSHSFHLF